MVQEISSLITEEVDLDYITKGSDYYINDAGSPDLVEIYDNGTLIDSSQNFGGAEKVFNSTSIQTSLNINFLQSNKQKLNSSLKAKLYWY